MTGLVGVVGAYGEVGAEATRALWAAGVRLRIGGRSLQAAETFAHEHLGPEVDCTAVDFTDDTSSATFVAGCAVVVNSAGPSHAIGNRLADAAWRAGADYVDAAGDDRLHALLDPARYQRASRVAVLSAGLQPGLTSLFPQAVATRFDQVDELTVQVGLIDRFTSVAADDYLQAAADGVSTPRAAWRSGQRAEGALVRRIGLRLPYVGQVTALPQLSTESERLARAIGLRNGEWYVLLAGTRTLDVFDRVPMLDRTEAVEALCRASRLDLGHRPTRIVIAVTAEGPRSGVTTGETVVLRGASTAELSGAVLTYATLAVLRGEVEPGRHYAAETLDPVAVVDALTKAEGPAVLSELTAFEFAEEGAL
ncbi:saccharopine dehydrogenase NADP-binding domain-containing protein [Kribbella sp. NPDC056861]|uniref:saccharopine dehydrogenase NADP-binding domain-containing protein n=1 Tax=Kribbella sp. NPDC056861 TaxID=3154857 RepID=UPI0034383A16